METINLFNDLLHAELNSVCFVANYIQLFFNGPIINCYILPILSVNNKIYKAIDNDYKNVLVDFIDKEIINISITDDGVKLTFKDNNDILLIITSNNSNEAIYYSDSNKKKWFELP